MDEVVKRVPPHSLEAEQSVIGSMIMDREAIGIALEHIDQHDFYHPDLKMVFTSIIDLYNRNSPVDLVTLQDFLKRDDQLDRIGGVEYLSKLAMSVPTSAHVKNYAAIVKEKSVLRRLIKTGQDIISDSYESKEELEGILNSAEEKIFNIIQNRKTEEFAAIKELINPTLNMIVSAHDNGDAVTGISTGFVDLDTKTAGLQPADLVLIAARPSMGKTAFALNVAQHAAVKAKISTAIFSLEMSKEQLVNRMLCSEAMVDAQKVRTGSLEDDEWSNLLNGAAILNDSPIFIDDTPGITVAEMKRNAGS